MLDSATWRMKCRVVLACHGWFPVQRFHGLSGLASVRISIAKVSYSDERSCCEVGVVELGVGLPVVTKFTGDGLCDERTGDQWCRLSLRGSWVKRCFRGAKTTFIETLR